jgi:hypothetical protein
VLDEALVWAAKSDRVEAVGLLVGLGAGVTAIHLAAQAGQREALMALLELGADPLTLDNLHSGNALGWVRVGGTKNSRTFFRDHRIDGSWTRRSWSRATALDLPIGEAVIWPGGSSSGRGAVYAGIGDSFHAERQWCL